MVFVASSFFFGGTNVYKEVRGVAPFLVPFLKMSCVYFVLWLPDDQPSITSAFVKCLPILALIWFVWLQGGNGYNLKILTGLVCSCLGDATLVWQSLGTSVFIAGMFFFACGLICYILAFGFSPFGFKEFIIVAAVCTSIIGYILTFIPEGVLLYGIMGYSCLITLMAWRALARFNLKTVVPWRKVFAAVGALLFVTSDLSLALNKFCWSLPWERTIIMVTYYAAQLCISLSVINSRLYLKEDIGSVH